MEDQPKTEGLLNVTAGQLGASLLGALFWISLAALIHPNAYGYLSWLFSIGMFASIFCLLGFEKTIVVFGKKGETVSKFFLIVLATSVWIAIALSLFVHWIVGISALGFSLFSLAVHRELAREDYGRYMWMWLGSKSLSIFLGFLLYRFSGLVIYILLGFALTHLIFSIPLFSLRISKQSPTKEEITFSAGALGSNVVSGSMQFVDKIIVGMLFGMSTLAVYQLAYRIFVLFSVVSQIFFFYLLPKKSNGEDTRKIERKGLLLSAILSLIVFVLSPLLVRQVFPSFQEGVKACQIAGLAIFPSSLSAIMFSELYGRKRPQLIFLSQIAGLAVWLGTAIVFGNLYGVTGLAASVLTMHSIIALFSLVSVSQPRLPVFYKKILQGLAIMLIFSISLLAVAYIYGERTEISGNILRETRLIMDTYATITVCHENLKLARIAVDAAFREISRIDSLMSEFDPKSEIYSLNNSGDWVSLSQETIFVLSKAKEYSKISGGCFDITVKPLVDLWMKKTRETGRMPSQDELENVLKFVDWSAVLLTENAGKLAKEGMKVTLGGIAKGYAVDRACEVLSSYGVENFLVDIGGDMRAFGRKGTERWKIGVQDPRNPTKLVEILEIENAAVATSGDYQRFFFLSGKRIHHIVDPRTGYPADLSMSVTVIASTCLDADALSTAVFVMGPENGAALIRNLSLSALIVSSSGEILKVNWSVV
ncbi:MAG: FAD:protein FMN transferase [Candidatus Hadarchaeales archaeon]